MVPGGAPVFIDVHVALPSEPLQELIEVYLRTPHTYGGTPPLFGGFKHISCLLLYQVLDVREDFSAILILHRLKGVSLDFQTSRGTYSLRPLCKFLRPQIFEVFRAQRFQRTRGKAW
jgi:hypothetical protein